MSQAVGRSRGLRQRRRKIPALPPHRPKGGFHSVGGLPKNAEKIEIGTGRRFYQKGDNVYYVSRKKDLKIRAEHTRGKKESHWRGDAPGQKT